MKNPGGSFYFSDTEFKLENMTIAEMLEILLDKTPAKIEFAGDFPEERMDLAIKFERAEIKDPKSFAYDLLDAIYGFEIDDKAVDKVVFTLTIADKDKINKITAAKDNFMTSVDHEGNDWIGKNVKMPILITFLERELGVVIRDETRINDALNIRFNRESPEKAMESLKELGFGIKETTEEIEVMIVEIGS